MPIRTERRGRILLVTLDRPEVHNSIDGEMFRQLTETWSSFDQDDSLSVAVVTGAGEKAFCSGFDLLSTAGVELDAAGGDPGSRVVPESGKPLIAAVNGYCLAGGLAIALGCDLRLCTPTASFGTMAIKRGLIAAAGQIQRLTRYIPFGKALEMVLIGDRIDAAEAHRLGLVNHVVPPAELMGRALEWAEKLCEFSPLALRLSKQAAYQGGLEMSFAEARQLEAQLFGQVVKSEDAAEGILAFAEKRPPRFTGR